MTAAHPADPENGARPAGAWLAGALVRYGLTLIYCFALCYAYDVLSRWWSYFGFTYLLNDDSLRIGACLVAAIPAILLDARPRTFAQAAAWFIYALVFLPCLIVPVMQSPGSTSRLIQIFSATFVTCILFMLIVRGEVRRITVPAIPPKLFWGVVLSIWLVLILLVLFTFDGSFQFATADSIYDQRFAGAGVAANPAVRYALAILSSAIDPFLIGAGLYTRRYWITGLGAVSQIILFGTLAARAVLLSPFIVIAAYFLSDRQGRMRGHLMISGLVVVFIATIPLLKQYNPVGGGLNQLTTLLYLRTLLISGATYGVYEQFFSINPATYLSNNTIVALFVPYPYGDFSVGQAVLQFLVPISGQDIPELNANFLATDGIAAFGIAGIPIAGVISGVVLKFMSRFIAPGRTMLMVASGTGFLLSLANTSLLTSLVTGGGILVAMLVCVAPLDRN
ncbi:hypothetical protein NED98_13260 [Sphingomonas sp. MMSM20]|uniref:hypothetical protein n=1 Tax=Sphingomonas lycopersici TaxID=2951807 RepID=UPI0022386703|nr:hypothetical protein [Sphingomonas lycopersici]MCW6531214.1 hypothetical protein [Sphingomonas lycopersici]